MGVDVNQLAFKGSTLSSVFRLSRENDRRFLAAIRCQLVVPSDANSCLTKACRVGHLSDTVASLLINCLFLQY